MQTFDKFLTNQQKDPDFLREYQRLEPERSIMRTLLDARMEQNLTQNELAEKIGISQTDISKLEKGTRNPPLRLLQRLADGLDLDLKVEFLPREKESIGDRK